MARSPNKAADAAPAVAPAEPAPIVEPTTAAAPAEPAPIAEAAPAMTAAVTQAAPVEPVPAPAAALTYVATTYIEHDGEPYNAGDPIVLTKKQAEPLAAVKAIKLEGDDDE